MMRIWIRIWIRGSKLQKTDPDPTQDQIPIQLLVKDFVSFNSQVRFSLVKISFCSKEVAILNNIFDIYH